MASIPNALTSADSAYLQERYAQGISDNDTGSWELDDIIDLPVAVVTDMATSFVNSIPFADYNVDTAEVLESIGAYDSARFYNDHRTTVQVASFFGSIILPGAIIGKSLQLARAGKYSLMTGGKLVGSRVNALREFKTLKSTQALDLVKDGDFYSKEYKRARRAWTGTALAEGVMEGAAFEAAFVAMFNGHPFMDEMGYDKTDFIIGTAFGAIFVPFRFLADRRVYKLAAAEAEQRIAQSGKVGIYPNHVGIAGTKGDQLTANMHQSVTIDEDMAARDWTGDRGGFELAQRNQRDTQAAINDVAIGMMDGPVQAASKRGKDARPPLAEKDFYKMSPLSHILRAGISKALSFSGATKFKFFNSASALGKEPRAVSDIRYEFIQDNRLAGSNDFAIEAMEGGSVESVYRMLTGKRLDLTAKRPLTSILPQLGFDNWKGVYGTTRSHALSGDGVSFTMKRETGRFELHIYDNGAGLKDEAFGKTKTDTSKMMEQFLFEARQEVGNADFKIFTHYEGRRPSRGGALAGLHQKGLQLSTEAGEFLTDQLPKSITADQIHGTRAAHSRQIFVPSQAKQGDQVGATIGVRDMLDLPENLGSFSVVEAAEGARIATFADIRNLAKEASEAGVDLTKPESGAATKFLKEQGFAGVEITTTSSLKRMGRAPGVVLFDNAGGRVTRTLPGDMIQASALQRASIGSRITDEFAVLDPYLGQVIPATVARSIQRAADLEDGYRINKKFSMQGQTTKEFDPFEMSTADADAMFLDALHAVRRDKPKSVVIDHDDLPRLNAAFAGDLGKGGKAKIRQADGTITPVRDQAHMGQIVMDQKNAVSRSLQESGYSMQQASVYTNTPLKGAEKFIVSGHLIEDVIKAMDTGSADEFFQYAATDRARLDEFLNAKQILVEGDSLANQSLIKQQQWSRQDAQIAINLHDTTVGDISAMQAAKIPVIGRLYNLVDRPEFRAMIKHHSAFFSKEVLGSPTFNSLDFALRKLDELTGAPDLGQFAVQTGKDFLRVVNETFNPMVDSVSASFAAIAKDTAALVQFNDIYKALQKLPKDQARNLIFDSGTGQFVTGRDELGNITSVMQYVRDGDYIDEAIRVTNSDTRAFFADVWPKIQEDLYQLGNTNRKLIGMAEPSRLGVWFPYNNLSEQNVAYIFDPSDTLAKARIIVGKTIGEMESQIAAVQKELDPRLEIVRRSDAELWNRITGYSQLNDLERADSSMRRSGILVENTPADTSIMDDILAGIQGDVWKHSRQYMKIAGSELFTQLDEYTKWHKAPQISNAGSFSQKSARRISTSEVISKTMLHQSMVNDSQILSTVNNVYTEAIEWSLNKLNGAWDTVLRKSGTNLDVKDWENMQQELAANNIPNPYKGWEDFVRQNPDYQGADAARFVARANSLLVTLNLRLMELSHAAINTFTIPVVIAGELAARDMPLRYMVNAAKRMVTTNRTEDARRVAAWDKGYSRGRIAEEVTNLLNKAVTKPSLLTKLQESKLVELLSKPSDIAENWAREMAYLTGYEVGLQKYGHGAPESLKETFANQFTERTMGNYTSRQRPTMFQGTWGATMGLYQTFMLSMGQQIFRFAERGQNKAMATLTAAQAGMFGMSSLPFFDPISRAVGAYISEENNDITSMTYELFGDSGQESRSLAEYMLYGLPSAFFQAAFYTRGELQPRLPFAAAEGSIGVAPPVINTMKQLWDFSWDTGTQVGMALSQGSPIDAARAVAEGISIQSIWRPGARISELITGTSFDRAGRIVDSATEARFTWGTFARVMGSRPLKEQVLRNLNFTGRYYDSKDQGNRRDAVKAFRSSVAAGDMGRYGDIFQSYIDAGGSREGWTQIENEAYLQASVPYANRLADDFEKRPEITGVLSGYLF